MTPPPPQPSRDSPPYDFIAEILLCLPPDEPASLFRASVVCSLWHRLISDRAFLRRYRAFHRTPPVLGLFRNTTSVTRFAPATAFLPADSDDSNCYTMDCRHGRVLLYDRRSTDLLIWDPVTGEKQHVAEPDIPRADFNAGVLCATAGCDHLDCHGGPFLVAFIGIDNDGGAHACLYSSETDAWSAPPTSLQLDYCVEDIHPVLVGDALYLVCDDGIALLRYDLVGDRGLSVIHAPDAYENGVALMPAEDGRLGLAGLDMFTLHLWSLETTVPDGVAGWARRRVIELKIPRGPVYRPYLLGFVKARNSDAIFVNIDAGIFMIELESQRARKMCERDGFYSVVPYTSFCTPAVRSRGVTAKDQGAAAAGMEMSSIDLEDGVTQAYSKMCLEAP